VLDREAVVRKHPAQDIFKEIGAQIADVGIVIDRRAAGVEADLGWVKRGEVAQAAGVGVI
jgi:hypothetical protein